MATKTAQGLVIKIIDYGLHDQIVHLLTSEQILVFIALGVKKMASKNRFALQLGNIIATEIFPARLSNKISKLKRASILLQPPIFDGDTSKVILIILNELNKTNIVKKNLFNAIKNSWNYFGYDFNHHIKTYVIFRLLNIYGINLNLKNCVECNRFDRINGFTFEMGGYSCTWHTKNVRSLLFLKAINHLDQSVEKYLKVDPLINQQIYFDLINYLRNFGSY